MPELIDFDAEEMIRRDDKFRRGLDTEFKISSNRFASIACLRKNIPYFVQTFGIKVVGVLTLTFRRYVDAEEARRRFNNAWRRFFRGMFGAWIAAVEFTKSGRIHFHVLVQCQEDIRAGFGFPAYTDFKYANQSASADRRPLTCKQRRELRDGIPANEALRELWRKLDQGLTGFGFGPVFDFFPIEKNEAALSNYLGKQFLAGLPRQLLSKKNVRLVSYSRGCPRAVPPSWRPPSPWFNQRLGALLRVFGLQDRSQLKDRLGSRWAYNLFQLMAALDFDHSEDWPMLPVGNLAPKVLSLIRGGDWRLDHYLGPLIHDVEAVVQEIAIAPGPLPPPPCEVYLGEVI